MSDPKLLRILDELASRLTGIDGTGDYYTQIGRTVLKDRFVLNANEAPAVCIFLGERTKDDEVGERIRYRAAVFIEGHHEIGRDASQELGIKMLADIQTALETTDNTLGGLLVRGLSFEREEIFYPEAAGNTVAARVEYEIPHIRRYGDPVN